MARATFEIKPAGPYSLTASVRFLEGFAPAAYGGDGTDTLRLAFVTDGEESVAGVRVRSEGEVVVGEVYGEADPAVMRKQVSRILSLDVDGSGFAAVGERDPVVKRLQERYPGLRPVLFNSPYEAAAWAIISHRIRIVQAAKIKRRMAEELGEPFAVEDRREYAFPAPSRLAQLGEFPGISGRKVDRLRSLAEATAEGKLDAVYLRSMPADEAIRELKKLPGIGDFSAELILLRGAGEPDRLPTSEPRLGRAVTMAYDLDVPPTSGELEEMAELWRPYRTWVSLYLRTMLEDKTSEISGSQRRPAPRSNDPATGYAN